MTHVIQEKLHVQEDVLVKKTFDVAACKRISLSIDALESTVFLYHLQEQL